MDNEEWIPDLESDSESSAEKRDKPVNSVNRKKQEKREQAIAILVGILMDKQSPVHINTLKRLFSKANNNCPWQYSFQNKLGAFDKFIKDSHQFNTLKSGRRGWMFKETELMYI